MEILEDELDEWIEREKALSPNQAAISLDCRMTLFFSTAVAALGYMQIYN